MYKKFQQKVDDAANGIALKDYTALEKELVYRIRRLNNP